MGLALVAVLIGAECVRAAVSHHETIGLVAESSVPAAPAAPVAPANLVAAELDPVFMQKLADRWRGPYERSRRSTTQAR
jgi:hypothetical protein